MVVFPNAKVNLGLYVTGKRTDGFHNLETVFYPVDWCDILEINPVEGTRDTCHFTNTGLDVGCSAEKNLIVRAYHLLAGRYDLPATEIHLHKIIPFGAGLGGGSSDAAFMLKAMNTCFGLGLTETELLEFSASLGSDCPFFIRNRPVFASGKGELLEDISLSLEGYRMVLVKPSFGVSTPEAYAGIVPQPAAFDLHRLAAYPPEEWKDRVYNDFETTVFRKYPRLEEIKQALYRQGALYASMTGSGSAVYGIFAKGAEVNMPCGDCLVWQGNLKG